MSEEEMIKAILKGDQKAFKLLVDNYQLMVVNTCHAFVHDRDEAEDIAQDVFIQVFENALQSGKLPLDLFFFRQVLLCRHKYHPLFRSTHTPLNAYTRYARACGVFLISRPRCSPLPKL